jgi:hypothetical protein
MIVKRGFGSVQAACGSLAAGAREEQLADKASIPTPKVDKLNSWAVPPRFIGALAYTPIDIPCRQQLRRSTFQFPRPKAANT